MKRLTLTILVTVLGPLAASADYDHESWNDPGKTNNQWSYYDTDSTAPYDVPMIWHSTGGVGGSGYVSTPLGTLDSAHHGQAYWPAYLYRGIGVNQEIDLSIDNAAISIFASDIGTTGVTPVALEGGSLYFFIGQYLVGEPGTEDDKWSFYYNKTPVTINSGNWNKESILPVGGDANWGVITDNDPAVNPSDLFYHPEQFGFTIFPATSTPSGVLALDSFSIVPEPSALSLLFAGIFGLLALARRRSR